MASPAHLSSTVPEAPPETQASLDVFVARQPIFGGAGGLEGYELLYRSNGTQNFAAGATPDAMGAHVITHGVLSIGLDQLVSDSRAWLNFTREMLLDDTPRLLAPQSIVVEVLETVKPDADVVHKVRALKKDGYQIALDDFVYAEQWRPLLEIADFVKVDVMGRSADEIASVTDQLRPFRKRLVAEKVETSDVQAICARLGYELFQGYYFSKPQIVGARELSAGQLTLLRLLNLLRDPDVSDARVQEAFGTDIALSYKLLRMVNSAAVGARGIESIAHAVRLTGRAHLHRWLSLILVSTLAGKSAMDGELVRVAVQRARVLELIASKVKGLRADASFLVGLFSCLDALLRIPMPEIMSKVDLAPEVRSALLDRCGPYAEALAVVEAYERGSWLEATKLARGVGVSMSELPRMYTDAISWTRETLRVA